MQKFINLLNRLRASLWLLPALMSGAAVFLAWLILFSGIRFPLPEAVRDAWLFSGDAGSARNLMSSLLTGMISMTSLVVSITMVVLSLAAGQLGPRLIVNFMQDRAIQFVLGLFIGTIFYILIVLRSINDSLGADAVPHIAVTLGSLLSAACLFALLFYVHKVARSIIADTVIGNIAASLSEAINGGPEPAKTDPETATLETSRKLYNQRRAISLGKGGYIQVIDHEALLKLAAGKQLLIVINVRAGHFVLRSGEHAEVFSRTKVSDSCLEEIRSCFVVGEERTPTQDLEYSFRQLVEIALRALSPGINDPFTALAVVDRIGAALEQASPSCPSRLFLHDKQGNLRLAARLSSFGGLTDVAFNQIRQAAHGHAAVLIHMASIIGKLGFAELGHDQRLALSDHLDKLQRTADASLGDPRDLADFAAAAETARTHLWPSAA